MSLLPLLLVASIALDPPGSDPLPDELERAIALLDALDTTLITIDADDEPLAAVLDRIGDQIPLLVDWAALDVIGVVKDDPMTLHLAGTPVATALAAVCLQSGDVFERPIYEAYKQQIVVTTHEASVSMRMTDVYDVRDLMASDEALEEVRATRPPLPAGAAEQPDAGADDAPVGGGGPALPKISIPSRESAPPRRLTRGEELMTLIVEHVDPDAWLGFGGTRAAITEHEGVLMVSAVPGTHRRLRHALRRLRSAHLTQVSIEAAIIDLPRSTFDRLRRRDDLSSALLGRALLSAPDGTVRWRTSTAAALERQLSLDARQDGVEIRFRLVPRFDRASGLLTLDLEAATSADTDVRSLSTSVTIPFRNGGSVLELPAAAPEDEVRLLILIPTRR